MVALSTSVRAAWEQALSSGRFATYLTAAGGDDGRALDLYRWNGKVAGAWVPLHGLAEVTIRNAIHDALRHGFGRDAWWDHVRLDRRTAENIGQATARIQLNYPLTPGRVVAELTLGDWVRLLGAGGRRDGVAVDYVKTLWRPHLAPRFKGASDRRTFHNEVERIRVFRNRIAHHEPLLKTNHLAEFDRLVDLMAIVNPVIADEIRLDTSIATLAAQRP
jgi:hypothetical protein